jgi:Zn-dependent protease
VPLSGALPLFHDKVVNILNDIPFLKYSLNELPFVLIALLIAFTVHEYAHAWTAWRFGDPTAKNEGRLTLNPGPHLDLVGTLLILVAGFGWAKPVPVNYANFRNPRVAGTLVALAGPLSNLLTAFVAMFFWGILITFGFLDGMDGFWDRFANQLFWVIIQLNVVLFFFNLIPLPFFDGYFIVRNLSPHEVRRKLAAIEPYSLIIFLVLVVTPLGDYVLDPIFQRLVPATIQGMQIFFSTLLS